MSMGGNQEPEALEELMRATRRACEEGLKADDLRDAADRLRHAGLDDVGAVRLVQAITPVESSQAPARALVAKLIGDRFTNADAAIERCLLIQSTLQSLSSLHEVPVVPSVKEMFCEEVQSWTRLEDAAKNAFRVGTSRFADMCMLASFRRFPGGQFDWVRGGVPLSYLFSVSPRSLPRALYVAAVQLGGRAPVFFSHFGYRRLGQPLSEIEANRSYYRMARSMELQPDIKGLTASSWFRSPDTHRVSPHLAWVNTVVLENGGFVAVRGKADPNCGVFVRSETRRRLYEAGEFTPTLGLVMWPRRAMLAWAAAHPELS
jgi:hypothetical protein